MPLASLLREIDPETFVERHFQKVPYSEPGGASEFVDLGSWETIERALSDEDPDVVVAREGRTREEEGVPTLEEARDLADDGWTIGVRDVQRHHPDIEALADSFETDLGLPVNVHLYCTPPHQHGFGWHYDVEDVVILQATGPKTYELRKNTVNPWPVLESMPEDLGHERETTPVMRCVLDGGDLLYLPSGYWHRAEVRGDAEAISLAVGLMPRTALEVREVLEPFILRSLAWRQRLPVDGRAAVRSPGERRERLEEILEDLRRDLEHVFSDPEFRRMALARLGAPSLEDSESSGGAASPEEAAR